MATPPSRDDLDALGLMRRRFKEADEAETPNRITALEAIEFYYGKQWIDKIFNARDGDGRPCLTLNRLPAIVRQILNEERANPPAIEVTPSGDGADDETAEVRQGLARHVELNSDAKAAYETAFQYMVIGGFGHWRVEHDYLEMSMNQELFISPIYNPFSVYWDPASQKPDRSDARYCFVTLNLSVDEHNEQYPDSELVGRGEFSGFGDLAPGWLYKDGARVVEYFYVEVEDAELVQLVDGRCVWADQIPKGSKTAKSGGRSVSRKAKRRHAFVCHSNGLEWLKPAEELPTDDIPIVSVFGDELWVNDENRIKGMVTDLIEPSRKFNYEASAIAEVMALGTKAPYMAVAEQVEPYMDLWRNANNRNLAVLPYHNVPGVPPPQKIATEPPIQAMSAARMQSADDLRSISGVYDATQSPKGGEESGRAILTRRHQASIGNNHYVSNLARGVKRTAQILLKYFPVIYDTARVMQIVGTDMQPRAVIVHAGQPDTIPAAMPPAQPPAAAPGAMLPGAPPAMPPPAMPPPAPNLDIYDLQQGTYKVAASVGPSYDTLRQETLDILLALVASEPQLAPMLADLIVNEMNFPNKKAFVERLQKALPPALQDNANPTDPNQLQAHNVMLMSQNQKLMQSVQQLTQMVQQKQIEGQSRERIEAMKLQAAQISAAARLEQQRLIEQANILRASADKQFGAAHDHAMSTRNAVHDMMRSSHQTTQDMELASHQATLRPAPASSPDLAADQYSSGLTQ